MYVFLDAITFRYRGAAAPVLDRLSLYVRSGEIAAVVGPAGAGKTTLLRYVGKLSDAHGRTRKSLRLSACCYRQQTRRRSTTGTV